MPDLSIEVDDLDADLNRVKAENIEIEYGPVSEPWGVRRFYVRDPFGKLMCFNMTSFHRCSIIWQLKITLKKPLSGISNARILLQR